MSHPLGVRPGLMTSLIRWRWGFVALLIVGTIIYEVLKQRIEKGTFLDLRLYPAAIIYGLVIPLLIGVLLSLEYDRTRLRTTVKGLNLQQVMIRQLANARDWEEISAILLQFPRTTFPIVGASLYFYYPTTGQYIPFAEWSQSGTTLPRAEPSRSKTFCSIYQKLHEPNECVLVPCCCLESPASSPPLSNFCIPLITGDREVAMLHLFLPDGEVIASEHADLLAGIAPEAALAIERTYFKNTIQAQTRSTDEMQDRFARYLHDTLGHNVAYMRLKLDQLVGSDDLRDSEEIRREIGGLLNVANEAYDQVRGTLIELRQDTPSDLPTALLETAELIAKRANFCVEWITKGEVRFLQPFMQRQILYIAREALRNTEKHAQAKNVKICLIWHTHHLLVSLSDDGKGFDVSALNLEKGHYGYQLMRECAAEINGQLILTSSPNQGTEMTLTIPYTT